MTEMAVKDAFLGSFLGHAAKPCFIGNRTDARESAIHNHVVHQNVNSGPSTDKLGISNVKFGTFQNWSILSLYDTRNGTHYM